VFRRSFRQQGRRDQFRLLVPHAVHDTVPDGRHRREERIGFQPVQHGGHGRAAAIDLAVDPAPERVAGFIHREPDARRAAIQRQEQAR